MSKRKRWLLIFRSSDEEEEDQEIMYEGDPGFLRRFAAKLNLAAKGGWFRVERDDDE